MTVQWLGYCFIFELRRGSNGFYGRFRVAANSFFFVGEESKFIKKCLQKESDFHLKLSYRYNAISNILAVSSVLKTFNFRVNIANDDSTLNISSALHEGIINLNDDNVQEWPEIFLCGLEVTDKRYR